MSWAGFVSAMVVDQYENPISNEALTFTSGTPVPNGEPCQGNNDYSPALLVLSEDECLAGFPSYDDETCTTADTTQILLTNPYGAAVSVIVGKLPDAKYPIAVSSIELEAETFQISTYPFGNCDLYTRPSKALKITYPETTDYSGKSINAAKAGDTVTFKAKLELLSEGETTINTSEVCDETNELVTCDKIVGDREFSLSDVDDGHVYFNGQEGTYAGDGFYEIDYVWSNRVKTRLSFPGKLMLKSIIRNSVCYVKRLLKLRQSL